MPESLTAFLQKPWVMAFFSAHYPWYALIAWAVIAYRVVSRRFTGAEWVLLAIFVGGVVLQILQVSIGIGASGRISFSDLSAQESEGLPRYFGVLAPMLWVWLAIGLGMVWNSGRGRVAVYAARSAVAVVVAALVFGMAVPYFTGDFRRGEDFRAMEAARAIAPCIKADYDGPKTRADMRYTVNEYFTSRRPVVFSDYGAAAWCVGGQSEGANLGHYPYNPDYVFLDMTPGIGKGYRGLERINPDDYEMVDEVHGRFGIWALFRHNLTPHASEADEDSPWEN